MRKTYKFVLTLFAIVYALNVSAQVSLEINVINANNEQLVGSEISVTAGDSTISFAIMSNPNYTMNYRLLVLTKYLLHIWGMPLST